MQVIVNGMLVGVDEVTITADIENLARQFSFVDVAETARYSKKSSVVIIGDTGLLITGMIEHIHATAGEDESTFTYSGRNYALYAVDGYVPKTHQFPKNTKLLTVLNKLLEPFPISAYGLDVKLPKDAQHKVVMGDKVADDMVEVAKKCGRILISDEFGNIKVTKVGDGFGGKPMVMGINLDGRQYVENDTTVYDKYTVIAQGSRKDGKGKSHVQGSVGGGILEKIIRADHPMTSKECKKMAGEEMAKDLRKSFHYQVTLKTDFLQLNKLYPIVDATLGSLGVLNLKSYTYTKSGSDDSFEATFELAVPDAD